MVRAFVPMLSLTMPDSMSLRRRASAAFVRSNCPFKCPMATLYWSSVMVLPSAWYDEMSACACACKSPEYCVRNDSANRIAALSLVARPTISCISSRAPGDIWLDNCRSSPDARSVSSFFTRPFNASANVLSLAS